MLAADLSAQEDGAVAGSVAEPDIDSLVHDLRGPLSVIVAFAESLDGVGREERARYAVRLIANAHRALAVLEEIGTPNARRVLEELSSGPARSVVTREAAAALERLANRRKP